MPKTDRTDGLGASIADAWAAAGVPITDEFLRNGPKIVNERPVFKLTKDGEASKGAPTKGNG